MFRRTPRLHLVALWLALCGMVLRGLVPAGFMPGWTQSEAKGGRSWLMVCPAGELQALLPQHPPVRARPTCAGRIVPAGDAGHGSEPRAHHIGEAHLGCPFAAAATPALPRSLAALALPEGALRLIAATAARHFCTPSTRRLPPARAPPSGFTI